MKIGIIRLSIFHGLVQMTQLVINFFVAIYLVGIGFSGSSIGLMFGLSSLATLITILPSGLSNDRFNSKHLIGFSLFLLLLQYLALALSNSYLLLSIVFALGGIGNALFTASAESLFHRSADKRILSKKIAIFQGTEYLLIASALIFSGALLNYNIEFKSLFLGAAGIILVLTIFSLFLPDSESTKLEIVHYKTDLLRKEVIFFLLTVLIFSVHFGAEMTSYGLFLENNLLLNRLQIGLYMGSAVAFMSLASLVIHKNSSKIKSRYLLFAGLFLSGIGHIFMTVNQGSLSFLARVVHEIGDAAVFFFLYVGVSKMFDLSRVGGNNGMMRLMTKIGLALGALVFGFIGANYGYQWPLILSGGTNLIAMLIAIHFSHLIQH